MIKIKNELLFLLNFFIVLLFTEKYKEYSLDYLDLITFFKIDSK